MQQEKEPTSTDPKESLIEKNKITVAENLTKAFEDGAETSLVAWGLAGVGNTEAMELRYKLLDAGADVNNIAGGLIGVEHEESMMLRGRLLNEGADVNYISTGLVATGNQLSMKFRKHLVEKGVAANFLSESLLGVDNKDAMDWREWLLNEGYRLRVIGGGRDEKYKRELIARRILWDLAGIDSEESMKLRNRLLLSEGFNLENINKEVHPLVVNSLLASFRWVGNEKSMDLREKALFCAEADGRDICLSLWGVDNQRSMELRKYLLEQTNNKKIHPINLQPADLNPRQVIANSLFGTDNQEAMRLREEIFQSIQSNSDTSERFYATRGLLTGLKGIASPESMGLREELVCIGKGFASKEEVLTYLAFSLSGVVNQESNKLRDKYFKDKPNLIAQSYGSGPGDLYPAFIPLHGYKD